MKVKILLIVSLLAAFPACADDSSQYVKIINSIVKTKLQKYLSDPLIIKAVEAQNKESISLSQEDINQKDLQWRAEVGKAQKPLIDKVMNNELSKFLSSIKNEGRGLYTEIFVMDNKGLNVGQSDITSDYWQGDEDKWQKTFPLGVDASNFGDVDFDESAQIFQMQASFTISDGDTPIGAITIGFNAEELEKLQ